MDISHGNLDSSLCFIQPAFCMRYSAYKLNKQSDNIQSWHMPFPILSQSVIAYLVRAVASWPAHGFLKRQVRWSGIAITLKIFQFVVIHTVKGFSVVTEAEIDVFLEFSCFFDDPANVGNLISGSSAFSKLSLCIVELCEPLYHDKAGIHEGDTFLLGIWNWVSRGSIIRISVQIWK